MLQINKINKKKLIMLPVSVLVILSFALSMSSCIFPEPAGEDDQDIKEEITAGIEVELEIKEGMTLTQIAEILEEKGIVDNAFVFKLFVKQEGKETSLLPGTYKMITGSEYAEVLSILTAGPPMITYKTTIPEGFTVKQTIEKVASDIPFVEYTELEASIDINNYSNYDYLTGKESLEGFLFPKTYELTVDYEAGEVIDMMLAQYQYETGSLDYSKATEMGFDSYDVLKIASMIEREAYIPEERELISAVIYNRINMDMPLGIDATLSYFLDKWDEGLTQSDLETDTQYNTRIYAGLPPTPICNPGLPSIKAALNPADVSFLYYKVTNSESHEHSFFDNYQDFINAEVN